jgi:hypothetical protein
MGDLPTIRLAISPKSRRRSSNASIFLQVEGLMKLMDGDHIGPFNLGNPGEFTMLELADVSPIPVLF